jgi:hypothetical protein
MLRRISSVVSWLLGPGPTGLTGHLGARWLFLRTLAVIYFSAFYSLIFQIRGLIGPSGILPAGEYLQAVAQSLGTRRLWYAPTLLWLGSGDRALEVLCWAGILASLLLLFNIWPRGMLVVCFLAFLSFVAAAQDFSGYQSDGMLLEAGLISFFFAPPGLRPGLGRLHPPSRAALYLLRWEWFRIYFESGVVKLASGEPQWRNFTALDEYYQNGPLPTWIGWYVQHLPHWFHAGTTFVVLLAELALAWMVFLPRRFRIACFCMATCLQISIILTANYTFLNYLVLSLGVLLLDDQWLDEISRRLFALAPSKATAPEGSEQPTPNDAAPPNRLARLRGLTAPLRLAITGFLVAWLFYATALPLISMVLSGLHFPMAPIRYLEPFRVADQYGLFAVMTRGRYEIEFQGSNDDGKTWTPYPFRYKPQDVHEPPRIYAPYQPRFDWNLWFASLGPWRQYPWVVQVEERLLENDAAVLSLFAGNPFMSQPPKQIRAVLWQYWFTDMKTKRAQGLWWRREQLGLYAPTLEREPDGRFFIVDLPVRSLVPNP